MKNQVEILSIEKNEGVSKKSGQAYKIVKAHCILFTDEGDRQIGMLNIPRGMEEPAPGMYDAIFGMGVDFQTRDIAGRLKELRPHNKAAPMNKPAPADKAAV